MNRLLCFNCAIAAFVAILFFAAPSVQPSIAQTAQQGAAIKQKTLCNQPIYHAAHCAECAKSECNQKCTPLKPPKRFACFDSCMAQCNVK